MFVDIKEALKKQQDLLKVVVLVLFIYHDSHNTDLQKLMKTLNNP